MNQQTYLASDDSALLRRTLEAYSGTSCLEVGAGNLGNLVGLADRFELVVGTDIVKPAVSYRDGRAWNLVLADTARCFRDGCFDLVAFNPPYVPSEGIEDVAVDGGADGTEVALRFLEEALRVVKKEGTIVMLLSSKNSTVVIERECFRRNFRMRKIAEERLFFESLYVFEATHQ